MSGSIFTDDPASVVPATNWFAGTIPGTTGNVDPNAQGIAGSSGIAYGTGTGQNGQVLAKGQTMGSGVTGIYEWLNAPFSTPLDPISVVLLVGIVLVAIIGWNFVLYHVRIAAESI
jgi:hypothetical protein